MKGLIITIGTAAATGFVALFIGAFAGYWEAADQLDHDVVFGEGNSIELKPREGVHLVYDETVEE